MKNKIFFICEGRGEQEYVKSLLKDEWLKEDLEDNIINSKAFGQISKYKNWDEKIPNDWEKIYFIIDKDVPSMIEKIKKRTNKSINFLSYKLGSDLKINIPQVELLIQNPNLDYFFAMHFPNFTPMKFPKEINNNEKEFRYQMKDFKLFLYKIFYSNDETKIKKIESDIEELIIYKIAKNKLNKKEMEKKNKLKKKIKKLEKEYIKEITLEKIQEKGGDIKNTYRQEKEFEILKVKYI